MKRQYPFFVLYLDIPIADIDVNVHPNKLDVRFADSGKIYAFVSRALGRTLFDIADIPSVTEPILKEIANDSIKSGVRQADSDSANKKVDNDNSSYANTGINTRSADAPAAKYSSGGAFSVLPPDGHASVFEFTRKTLSVSDSGSGFFGVMDKARAQNEAAYRETPLTPTAAEDSEQALLISAHISARTVGVLFNTYIIVETEREFFMLDQHAAHERLIYDKLTGSRDTSYVQDLLFPYLFDVNHLEKVYIDDCLPVLNDLGFSIEPFGNNSYKINAVPGILSDMPLNDFLKMILLDVSQKRRFTVAELMKEHLAQTACKAAVKGGDKLPEAEINRLIAKLAGGESMPVCPHGRPIAVKISQEEVEKWFKRIIK
jgi:DNA mismatch repair protein MutL